MTREPLLTIGTLTALVAAVVALLVAFGVPLTGDQREAILGAAAVVAPLVVAFLSRPKVTPNATVAEMVEDAVTRLRALAAAQS